MPLVTVIIPNYNHENFLQQRIESVLCQTFQDFEIIIFDDASTDSSLGFLNKYKNNSKVSHFVVNKQNSGSPFKQWEKGLKLAKGRYIWIAETDDFAENLFLEKSVAEFANNNEVVLTYTDSNIVDEKGKYLEKFSDAKSLFFKTKKWSDSYVNDGLDEILDFLLYKVIYNNVSSVLFIKSSFEKLDFDRLNKFKNAGDLFTYISICFQGKVSYIPLALNNYREHQNNLTKKSVISGIIFKERLECFDFVLDYLITNGLTKTEKNRIKLILFFFIIKNGLSLLKFNYSSELNLLIIKCRNIRVIGFFQKINYIIAAKIYYMQFYKAKSISEKIIKKTFPI
jgi:glycosyltransferase involved in cell wall biosynthesis